MRRESHSMSSLRRTEPRHPDDVESENTEYKKRYLTYKRGEHPPYTQDFQFALPKSDTKDLDTSTT